LYSSTPNRDRQQTVEAIKMQILGMQIRRKHIRGNELERPPGTTQRRTTPKEMLLEAMARSELASSGRRQ